MNWKNFSKLYGAAPLLLVSMLAGCASSQSGTKNQGGKAMKASSRAIISFQLPTSDSPKLNAAIAEACACQPVFVRPFLVSALIYQIALPADISFAAFAKTLMRNADQLGIHAVEEDRVLRHQ